MTNFDDTGVIQYDTIAASGTYLIAADGAQGGSGGGLGAEVGGDIDLAAGAVLEILVGGEGGFGGGGGGSFVAEINNGNSPVDIILAVAGGGGGGGFGGGGGGGYGGGGGGGIDGGGADGGSYLASSLTDTYLIASANAGNGQVTINEVPCYARGTRILTVRGEVAIEALAVGDRVVTASGGMRPVRWLGHRRLDVTRHPDPAAVWPVRVRQGAFGAGKPARDLWLSPGHNIAAEGALMPISALVNGSTVVQVQCPGIEYWHVELDGHDVILAEGLPAESYLDTGNRTGFANGGAFVEAHPDFRPKHWAETCLPLVFGGAEVDRVRLALYRQATLLGYAVTSADDMHVIAGGRRVRPTPIGRNRFVFLLPADCAEISLRSRSFVPAFTRPPSDDRRALGLCVSRIRIDRDDIALDDAGFFAQGWHRLESAPGQADQRWTTGTTPMPAGTRVIMIELAGRGYYWEEPQEPVVARVA